MPRSSHVWRVGSPSVSSPSGSKKPCKAKSASRRTSGSICRPCPPAKDARIHARSLSLGAPGAALTAPREAESSLQEPRARRRGERDRVRGVALVTHEAGAGEGLTERGREGAIVHTAEHVEGRRARNLRADLGEAPQRARRRA